MTYLELPGIYLGELLLSLSTAAFTGETYSMVASFPFQSPQGL